MNGLMFGGFSVFIAKPYPVYKQVSRFKKSRKKKNWTSRIKVFSHLEEFLMDGEIAHDKERKSIHMNEATFRQFKLSLEKRGLA